MPLDPDELRHYLHGLGLAVGAGPLAPLGPPTTRVVLSDRRTVVVRATRHRGQALARARAELRWAAATAPAVPLQRPLLEDPLVYGDWVLTLWEYLDGRPLGPGDAVAHGAALRHLHDLARPDLAHGTVADPLGLARTTVAALSGDRVVLRERLRYLVTRADDELRRALAPRPGTLVVAHGDCHPANALVVDGAVVMIDLDQAGLAPRRLDLADGLFAWGRMDPTSDAPERFLEGYGLVPGPPEALDALVWVREVRDLARRARHPEAPLEDLLVRLAALEAADAALAAT